MIVETAANELYRVEDAGPGLEHVFRGVAVKRTRDGFVPRAKARPVLVRRAGCRVIDDEGAIATAAARRCDEIEERNAHVAEPFRSILNIFSAGVR